MWYFRGSGRGALILWKPWQVLSIWRPTPLVRAARLEKALGLGPDVKIFYKYEGVSPSGSHKTNTAIAQVSVHGH